MKLSTERVDRTLSQFEAMPLPEDHPAIDQLNQLFGDHTFFLTVSGLHVVEPTEAPAEDAGQVVKLASWSDPNRTSLVPHEPEPTEVVVDLSADGATGGAAGGAAGGATNGAKPE